MYGEPFDIGQHSAPGTDTRQWGSYGTVMAENGDQKSVEFTPEYGPLVMVTLHPSNIDVRCRVASQVAGNGEGEWFPFLEGDEVWVEIPQGDENSGCLITARLNNEIDAWPRQVAGMDTTTNTFGFRRLRTPYVVETASSYLVRSASTGAFFGINQEGALTFSNSDNAFLTLNADFLGLQNGDGDVLIQIDVNAGQALMEAKGTKFIVDGSSSTFNTSGTLDLATSGGLANGHAITMEQVVVLLVNYLHFLGGPSGVSTTLKGELTGVGKLFDPSDPSMTMLSSKMLAWLPAAAAPQPLTPASPGGSLVGVFGAGLIVLMQAALAAGGSPASAIDVLGFFPGFGRPGLRI
jgi:hypothetical protein